MKQILIVLLLSMFIFSCGTKQHQEAAPDSESRAFELQRENFFNSLKNPDEMTAKLNAGIISFDSSILNSPKNFIRYAINDVKIASNLGIYIADLNYCILLKQRTPARKYFEAAYELSKAIRIEKGILDFLMKRYETNIDQSDSVKSVVNQLFGRATSGLQGTDRERLAGIAMAGYQIENLHLALTILATIPDAATAEQIQTKKQLQQLILEQRGKFEVIYNFVRAHADPLDPNANPDYPFFDNSLRELIDVYQNITEGDLRLDELHQKASALRNRIVK